MAKSKVNPMIILNPTDGCVLGAGGVPVDKEESWKKDVEEEAIGMAGQFEYAFHKRMQQARKKLPIPSPENLGFQINTFVDATLATTAGLLGKYVNISTEFENALVEGLRDKFKQLRQLHIENKGPI